MPPQSGISLEGVEQLQHMLKDLPENVRGNRILGQALGAAMRPAVRAAKGMAPVDLGLLKKVIVQKLLKKRRNGQYRVVTMGPDKNAAQYSSGGKKIPVALYGTVVEFGWSDTGISPSGRRNKKWRKRGRGSSSRPPRPFMRPALDAQRPYVLSNMAKDIGKKIEKAAAKLAKTKR